MTRARPYTADELSAKRERARAYNARPDVVARKREYANRPDVIARRQEYYQRPEVKQRYVDRRDSESNKEYCKQWRSTEAGKRKLKESGLRQRGFTLELWESLMEAQGNACAICREKFPENYREIHADHCHDSLVPRGLLCQPCNLAEGQIRKTGLSPEEFGRRLESYLGNPPAARVVAELKSSESRREELK